MAKDKRIQEEIDRITTQFESLGIKSLEILKGPIEEVSFMKIKLNDLKDQINKDGFTEVYQNGANQTGIKKSSCVDIYNTMVKNYTTLMKEIMNRFPKEEFENSSDDDDFDHFLRTRDD